MAPTPLPELDPTVDVEDREPSDIRRTFRGATVFVTGGTGFLGKLLIEKLLRCCPEIKRLYMMARSKKGKDIQGRLQEQFDDVVYSRLKKQNPHFANCISPIEGDMSEIGLGLSEVDRETIINDVDFIFHCAATVRFDEPLKTAVFTNVRGTRELLHIARCNKRLKAMVHVSTAYSHCTRPEIDEKYYDVNLPGENLISMIENMNDDTIERITDGLVGKYPNTYTYTKAAAENILLDYLNDMPIAVIRPSIVTATSKEPLEGWIDNINGPSGVGVGAGYGVLRVMRCNPASVVDLVPGDMVINVIVAAAHRLACTHIPGSVTMPFMAVTSPRTPVTWGEFSKIGEAYSTKVPTTRAFYKYILILEPSYFWYTCYSLLYHWIPAYVVDAVLFVLGKEPKLKKVYTKIEKMTKILTYFALNQWTFVNDHTMALYRGLNKTDQEIFDFDFDALDWSIYLGAYIRGMRLYLLKESPETIPEGKKLQAKLHMIHNVVKFFVISLFLVVVWHVIKFVFRLTL